MIKGTSQLSTMVFMLALFSSQGASAQPKTCTNQSIKDALNQIDFFERKISSRKKSNDDAISSLAKLESQTRWQAGASIAGAAPAAIGIAAVGTSIIAGGAATATLTATAGGSGLVVGAIGETVGIMSAIPAAGAATAGTLYQGGKAAGVFELYLIPKSYDTTVALEGAKSLFQSYANRLKNNDSVPTPSELASGVKSYVDELDDRHRALSEKVASDRKKIEDQWFHRMGLRNAKFVTTFRKEAEFDNALLVDDRLHVQIMRETLDLYCKLHGTELAKSVVVKKTDIDSDKNHN